MIQPYTFIYSRATMHSGGDYRTFVYDQSWDTEHEAWQEAIKWQDEHKDYAIQVIKYCDYPIHPMPEASK